MAVSRETFTFRTDSDITQLAAISAGFGVGVTHPGIARNRGLTRVMANVVVFRLGVWIVMHENLRASRRMRAMFDHLVDGMTAYTRNSRDCE
jgi:DNA-binding transcriptional LysR family regulator